jgi:Ca2+-binding EF-hand superfamily protein
MKLACRLLSALTIAAAGVSAAFAVDAPQYSTGVRVLGEKKSPMPQPGQGAMMRPEPSSAAGVPPQYRTRPSRRTATAKPDDSTVRFLVPLVERPVLIEARITIDGKPFRTLREERIDKLAAELAQPAPQSAEAAAKANSTDAAPTAPGPEVPASEAKLESESKEAAGPQASGDADDAEQALTKAPVPPLDNSLPARLRRYAASTKRTPSRDELRWLLTYWADGPTLLLLDENVERLRAEQAPLVKALDQDEDGIISSAEIAAAQATLLKYDRNQDDVLSLEELAAAATRTPDKTPKGAVPPPLVLLEDLAQSHVFARLAEQYSATGSQTAIAAWSRFDPNADGRTDAAEMEALQAAPPDLQIVVAFDSRDPSRSRVEATVLDAPLGEAPATIRRDSMTLLIAGTLLEISAVQSPSGDAADQVSLGAVRDGYPLLPDIDVNEDGRLTLREMRKAPERLAAFDRDKDGAISAGELAPTVRVAIGRGVTAHLPLAVVRSLHPPTDAPAVEPPAWFVSMDRNKDGDLSRREFPGGQQQFDDLDSDGDQLISGAEAANNEKTSSKDG